MYVRISVVVGVHPNHVECVARPRPNRLGNVALAALRSQGRHLPESNSLPLVFRLPAHCVRGKGDSSIFSRAVLNPGTAPSEARRGFTAGERTEPAGSFSPRFYEEWFPQRAKRARKPDEVKSGSMPPPRFERGTARSSVECSPSLS